VIKLDENMRVLW